MSELVYPQYSWKPEYDQYKKTFGGFGIIPGLSEGLPAVLIKQRNGKGGSPYLFDLPGGGINDATDPDLEAACIREIKEEVGLDATIFAKVGTPLWMPIKKDGVIQRVDCAQAFLVLTQGTPGISEEALATAFVNVGSVSGFNIVSRTADPDPAKRIFGRTPIMIWDGLSVLQKPFYSGPWIEQLVNVDRAPVGISAEDAPQVDAGCYFFLIDNGRYLARTYEVRGSDPEGARCVDLFYRLNPNEPGGRFHGALEDLVREIG